MSSLSDNDSSFGQATETASNDENGSKWPNPKGLFEFLMLIGSIKNLTISELDAINFKCFMLSNSVVASSFDKNIYKKFIKKLIESNKTNVNISVDELITSKSREFAEKTTDGETLNEVIYKINKFRFITI